MRCAQHCACVGGEDAVLQAHRRRGEIHAGGRDARGAGEDQQQRHAEQRGAVGREAQLQRAALYGEAAADSARKEGEQQPGAGRSLLPVANDERQTELCARPAHVRHGGVHSTDQTDSVHHTGVERKQAGGDEHDTVVQRCFASFDVERALSRSNERRCRRRPVVVSTRRRGCQRRWSDQAGSMVQRRRWTDQAGNNMVPR